jgi:hypothetical protein
VSKTDADSKPASGQSMSPEDEAFLRRIAKFLVIRRLAVPSILFLESVKPLNFVGSQFMFFFEPMVKVFVGGEGYTRFAQLMEKRENVETLLRLIEVTEEEQKASGGTP